MNLHHGSARIGKDTVSAGRGTARSSRPPLGSWAVAPVHKGGRCRVCHESGHCVCEWLFPGLCSVSRVYAPVLALVAPRLRSCRCVACVSIPVVRLPSSFSFPVERALLGSLYFCIKFCDLLFKKIAEIFIVFNTYGKGLRCRLENSYQKKKSQLTQFFKWAKYLKTIY